MNHESSNIAIVILAAGASSRMGTAKQLLRWGEDTLIRRAIHTALKVTASEVIVVLGANYNLIEKEIKDLPIIILKNKDWQLGLGKSIACAANYIINSKPQVDGILITLADQPLIDAEYLNELISAFSTEAQQIIATAYDKDKQGVPVLFDKVYFEQLSLLHDDKGAKQLLKTHPSFVKTLMPPVKNVDLDSEKDYKALYKKNFKH